MIGHRRWREDRERIVSVIQSAAQSYKENLVGRTFLYVFDGRYIEVLYKAQNFKHLTGVESRLSARDFYKAALRRQLQGTQIFFNARHPYQLCQRKLQHLQEVSALAYGESFLLEEIVTNTRHYKFGTTDLNFSLCMNKELDAEGREKGSCYVVESLRDEDCFSKSKNVYVVTHIFRKRNDQKFYAELCYQDAHVAELPSCVNERLLTRGTHISNHTEA